jgi:hypothetical protein
MAFLRLCRWYCLGHGWVAATLLAFVAAWPAQVLAAPGVVYVTVDVHLAGNGSGAVADYGGSQSCRTDCTFAYESYPGLPEYYLVMTADPGSRLATWTNCYSLLLGWPYSCRPDALPVSCPSAQYEFCAHADVTVAFWRIPRGDANGDGKVDLFWREASGSGLSWWTMSGATVSAANYYSVEPDWQLAQTCDLTGDGKTDLVWRRPTDGSTMLWALDGHAVTAYHDLGNRDASQWTLDGCADFDRDGKSDLLWRRNADGYLETWFMDGGAVASQASAGTVDPDWKVAALADMNRDGYTDIVWRRTSDGATAAWFMNGVAVTGGGTVATVDPLAWTLAASADFDGNGKADLLWRGADGAVWVWLMDGTSLFWADFVGNPGAAWTIASVADLDGDGKADLVWRHADGSLYWWKMNGAMATAFTPIASPGGAWRVVAP